MRKGDGELEHIARTPLPWRDDGLTECGLDAARYPTQTREDFLAKVKNQGQTRAALTTCMTCWQTARRYFYAEQRMNQDVLTNISREIDRVQWGGKQAEDRDRLVREFTAMAALITEHRGEFDAMVEGLADATNLATVRATKRARAQHARGTRR